MAKQLTPEAVEKLAGKFEKLGNLSENVLIAFDKLDGSIQKGEESADKFNKAINLAKDAAEQTAKNANNMGKSSFKGVDWKQVEKAMKAAVESGEMQKDDYKLKKKNLDAIKKEGKHYEAANDMAGNISSGFDSARDNVQGMVGKIPGVGKKWSASVGKAFDAKKNKALSSFTNKVLSGGKSFAKILKFSKALAGPLAVAGGFVVSMALNIHKFATNTGLSYAQTVKLGSALAVNEKAVTAMTKEFGNINEVTTGLAVQMKRMSLQFSISEENAAAILRVQKAVSGATNEQLLNMQMATAQLARQRGVAPADVFADIAGSTEAFAKFSADGGKNVMAAAVSAKSLGLNLSTVQKVAEGLLDIEGSISKQMEASVLIGRELNLDKARQLALSGDLEGVLREVKNQVGGEAEFNRMNVIQRQKLAEAVGLSTSELARLTTTQANTMAGAAAASGAAIGEGAKAQIEATHELATVTEKGFKNTVDAIKE